MLHGWMASHGVCLLSGKVWHLMLRRHHLRWNRPSADYGLLLWLLLLNCGSHTLTLILTVLARLVRISLYIVAALSLTRALTLTIGTLLASGLRSSITSSRSFAALLLFLLRVGLGFLLLTLLLLALRLLLLRI